MKGQFYCTQAGKFLPCEEALIGKRIQCPLCGGDHDVVPAHEAPTPQASGHPLPGAETSRAENHEVAKVSPKPPASSDNPRVSKGGLIMAGLFLFAGLTTCSELSYEAKISSLRAILIGLIFLFRSFYPPLRWWQGFLIFFGSGFVTTGLLEGLFSDRDMNSKLAMLVIGTVCAIPLLYFGFRRKREPQAATDIPAIDNVDGSQARLARFGERLLAWLIDVGIMFVLAVVMVVVFRLLFPDWTYELTRIPETAVLYFTLFVFGLMIEIVPTRCFGQSIGKRVLGLQVTQNNSNNIGLLKSIGRYALKWTLSMTLFLGGLWILFNKRRKAWHDMICRTQVAKLPGANPLAPTWGAFIGKMIAIRPLSYPLAALLIFFIVSALAGWGSTQSKWIKKAELLKGQGNFEASLAEYNHLIETHPGFGESYRMRGRLHAEQFGDIERAIRDYEAAAALNGRDKEALYQLVQLYMVKARLLTSRTMPIASPSDGIVSPPESVASPPEPNGTLSAPSSLSAETGIQWRSRPGIRPLDISVVKPLDLGGRSPELVAGELKDKTETTIMRSLALDPNSDDLREIMKTLDPSVELPVKRPCFVMTAASGDAGSFEVRTLSRFRDRYLLGHPLGEALVRQYYEFGPRVAHRIASAETLRIATRFSLQPVVAVAWILLQLPD